MLAKTNDFLFEITGTATLAFEGCCKLPLLAGVLRSTIPLSLDEPLLPLHSLFKLPAVALQLGVLLFELTIPRVEAGLVLVVAFTFGEETRWSVLAVVVLQNQIG